MDGQYTPTRRRWPLMRKGVLPWHLKDWVMVATCLSMLYSIVRIPPIPIAPLVFMPVFLAWFCRAELQGGIPAILGFAPVRWVLAAWALAIFWKVTLDGLAYTTVAEAARIVSAAIFLLALTAYCLSGWSRARRLTNLLLLSIFVSMTWYLFELSAAGPLFVGARLVLYADLYAAQKPDLVETIRSGLTPFTHLLGYQITAFAILILLRMIYLPGIFVRLISALGVGAALLALYFSSQRASFLALAAGAVGIVLVPRFRLRFAGAFAFAVLMLFTVAAVVASSVWIRESSELPLSQLPLSEKLADRASWEEAAFRGALQMKAVELIARHPLGLPAAGVTWSSAGFFPTAEKYGATRVVEQGFAVHNSYLGYALEVGIGIIMASIPMLLGILRSSVRLLGAGRNLAPDEVALYQGTALAGFGLFFVQAMTHNASILTREPTSLIVFALLTALVIYRRRECRRELMQAS